MCVLKPPNFKCKMKKLWELKEWGWKNVHHVFQHIVSLSPSPPLSLLMCLCVVLHFSWFNMCFSKPPNFKWRMKILWESKESGWKNVDHAFQHIVSLSLLSCPILVAKCVSSKPPNFKWKTKILWGIHGMGLEEMMLLIMLSYTLLSVSIFYLKLFLITKSMVQNSKIQMENEDMVGLQRKSVDHVFQHILCVLCLGLF